jgi:hypothetical protein
MNAQLQQLYDELYEELLCEVEALSGTIDTFSPEDQLIFIQVDPEYQEYLEMFLVELLIKYEEKKKQLLGLDVFEGVKQILS